MGWVGGVVLKVRMPEVTVSLIPHYLTIGWILFHFLMIIEIYVFM